MLAPLVGAFADSMPKGRVMLITNAIKIVGCVADAVHACTRSLAYAIVGFGAAAYSPAKYGILTELLPPQQLVVANGWIEGTTVGSIILGVLLGGVLISPARSSTMLLGFDLPMIDTGIDTPPEAAISVITVFYVIAAIFNCVHSRHRRRPPDAEPQPVFLIREFSHCVDAAVARQARPDLARDDDAVLGRRRDAAVHRDRLGRDARWASTCRRRRSCRASSRSASPSAP